MAKVKLTVGDSVAAFQALIELVKDKRPMKVALKMRRLARELRPHVEDYEAERMKLLEQYAARAEDGSLKREGDQFLFPDAAARKAFGGAVGELLACTWECETTLTIEDFGEGDVQPELLVGLGDLLEEPGE